MSAPDLASLRALAEAAREHTGAPVAIELPVTAAEAHYLAAVSPDVVMGLLDERDRLAARVLELEAPGECQSLHKLRAERDELAAEVSAYQGRPEGALPGWEWSDYDNGYVREFADECVATAVGCEWNLHDHGQNAGRGNERSPRALMRAAEAVARSRGWM